MRHPLTPPSQATEKVDISFILLNPKYAERFKGSNELVFSKFIENMSADYEETLIAKGYTMRGPYDDYYEIVFSDKTVTDLCTKHAIHHTNTLVLYPQSPTKPKPL